MSQGGRSRISRITAKRQAPRLTRRQWISRFVMLGVILALLIIASALVYASLNQRGSATAVEFELAVNPSLGPLEGAMLATYLSANQDALNTPAGTDSTEVAFEVMPGQNAAQIADKLVSAGLIADSTLFRNYLRYYGLDRQLEAGTYQLAATMTIPEIAITLTDALPEEITIRVTEGWRREQFADLIDQDPNIPFTGAEFLAATSAGIALPQGSTLPGILPPGATLEGFLFPDTYRLAVDATAEELVEKMLTNFENQVTAQMRADAAAGGMSMYEVISLASIVEREAVVPEERSTIASVYLNRLASGTKLQADPTVQYAMGYQTETDQWWNLGLTQDDYYAIDSPYNTYLYAGLPPGPIASPGLDSIRAVIYSAETPYYYFRAACDGSGRHVFAVTYEEHVANACP